MAKLERVYNIPLRKEFLKVANWKRTGKAVKAAREFLMKHMKSDKILLGEKLNLKLWENGIRKPPHHVKVTAIRDDDGTVRAELFGFPYGGKAEELAKAKKKTEVKKETTPAKEEAKTEAKKETLSSKEKKTESTAEEKTEKPRVKRTAVKKKE